MLSLLRKLIEVKPQTIFKAYQNELVRQYTKCKKALVQLEAYSLANPNDDEARALVEDALIFQTNLRRIITRISQDLITNQK